MATYNSQTFEVLLDNGIPTWTPGEPSYTEYKIPGGSTVLIQQGPKGLDRLTCTAKVLTITVADSLKTSRGTTLRTLGSFPIGGLSTTNYSNVMLFHVRVVRWPTPLSAVTFLELEFARQPT